MTLSIIIITRNNSSQEVLRIGIYTKCEGERDVIRETIIRNRVLSGKRVSSRVHKFRDIVAP